MLRPTAIRIRTHRHVDLLRSPRFRQTPCRDAHHRQPARRAERAARHGTGAGRPPRPRPLPPDGGWPRAYTTASGAALVVYQPQISSWADQKHVVLYAAVSYTPKGAKAPALGTVKVESDTSVALDERLVSFSEFKITESNFPTLQRDQLKTIVAEIVASVPLDERVIALDRVLANIDTSQIIPKNVEGVKADPPPIFFSKTPAVLVNIDGDPIWAPIPQNDLTSAVNTNWDLFEHGPTKTYLPPQRQRLAEGDRRERSVGTGRHAAGELREAACRRATGKR